MKKEIGRGLGVPRRTRQESRLNSRESGICLRVREAREIAQVTQEKLARLIGIPRDRLSTYEKCRAPIRFDVGLRICRQLIISEEWLATGATRIFDRIARVRLRAAELTKFRPVFQRQCFDLQSDPVALAVPPGTLFSEAFDKFLSPTYAKLAERFFYHPRIIFTEGIVETDLASRLMTMEFERSSWLLDNEARQLSADSWLAQRNLLSAMIRFLMKAHREISGLKFDIAAFQLFVQKVEEVTLVKQTSTRVAKEKQAA